jgi:hypothetical protein
VTFSACSWPIPRSEPTASASSTERHDTRNLAEVLMDLEADDGLRVQVIGLLEELENLSR